MKWTLAAVYLLAVVAANLAVAEWGPPAVLWVGFLGIGLTLAVRDAVHDLWGRWAVPVTLALIVAGGVASFLLNAGAQQVALASLVAFMASELADLAVYQSAREVPWLGRSNASNVVGAIVDSMIFPAIAFGGFSLTLSAGQIAAKIAGGAVFSVLLWALTMRRRSALT